MKHQILHSHYMKPMSSKHVVNKSSALPISAKMNILTTDLVRVMRNVSNQCQEGEHDNHIQQFIHRMQYSCYSHADRIAVYKKAWLRFKKMVQESENGGTPLYRGKKYPRKSGNKEKDNKQRKPLREGGGGRRRRRSTGDAITNK